MKKFRQFIREHWGKSILFIMLGYCVHLYVEAFIVTNVLALAGLKIPVLIG